MMATAIASASTMWTAIGFPRIIAATSVSASVVMFAPMM